ncbi:hypothetical protein Hanom_Chr03g00219801 [Helianthus anomalus]
MGTSPSLPTYVDDPLSIGSFHAVAFGIAVVSSLGVMACILKPELHGRALGPDGIVSQGNVQTKL